MTATTVDASALAAALLAGATRLLTGVRARWVCTPPACTQSGPAQSGSDQSGSDQSGPTRSSPIQSSPIQAAPTQRVYFANHSSHLDTLVIWAALPAPIRARTRPVAAADYWDRPGLRRWVAGRVLNALLVQRAGGCGSREALRQIAAALAAGDSLILFPEGTRGDGSDIGELKPGLYFVARERPDVELVPVCLQDLNRILPKGEVLPVPIIGSATFGAPLALLPDEGREAFLARARAALLALRGCP